MFRFDRLTALAKDMGISKSHLCRLINKGNNYIQDAWKKGVEIPVDTAAVWAEALHTTVEYLTGMTDDPKEKSPTASGGAYTDDEIVDAFNRADEKTQEAIRLLLKLK